MTRPIPDPSAFEEPVLILKKQKKDHNPTPTSPKTPSTPKICPKAPSKTPHRSPPQHHQNSNGNGNEIHFLTQRKRTKSCSTHFEYLMKLGEGCFGDVWKARSLLDDRLYAIKKSKKPIWETSERTQQLEEIEKGIKLGSHPNIATVMAAWEEGGHLYIQMELCEKGNLKDILLKQSEQDASIVPNISPSSLTIPGVPAYMTMSRSVSALIIESSQILPQTNNNSQNQNTTIESQNSNNSQNQNISTTTTTTNPTILRSSGSTISLSEGVDLETQIWRYIADIALGLSHIHSNGIVHLDIKPENLLVANDGSLKICDFGVSDNGDNEGDQVYMAPELLDEIQSPAADIFSFGITIYEIATGYILPSQGQWWRNLREGNIPFPEDSNTSLSQTLKDLIISMMNPDHSKRPSIQNILESEKLKDILASRNLNQSNSKLRRKLF
eukprot:gene7794-9593_t